MAPVVYRPSVRVLASSSDRPHHQKLMDICVEPLGTHISDSRVSWSRALRSHAPQEPFKTEWLKKVTTNINTHTDKYKQHLNPMNDIYNEPSVNPGFYDRRRLRKSATTFCFPGIASIV